MADTVLVRPDGRKSLRQLHDEWETCTRCNLGERRLSVNGQFVFGRGTTNSLLFVGEGPGVEEEQEGEPFVGRSGDLLKRVLQMLGVDEYYMTNIVTCRACAPQTGADGQPLMRTNYRSKQPEMVWKDEPPMPFQYNACLPRLHEEIYLADPTVVITLGGKAAEALLGHPVTITRDRGEPVVLEIPGASYAPVLTDKKQDWLRRTKEGLRTVTEQNMVRYHMMPTLHPAYVLRKLADKGPDSPFIQFVKDIKRAVRTHEHYSEMVFGVVPTVRAEPVDEEMHEKFQADAQGEE